MFDPSRLRGLAARMTAIRSRLFAVYPFYGRLLLHLSFGFAACGTAFTDMKQIVFDPAFADSLSDDEMQFVFLHELLHCVLHHCTRGRSLRPLLYNVACDVVVNSLILEILAQPEFLIAGEKVMHLAPDGSEGRLHNAEEVYDMLLSAGPEILKKLGDPDLTDTHIVWQQITDAACDDLWEEHIRNAVRSAGTSSGIPYSLKRYLKEISHTPKTNWRQLLQDFLRHDRSDFSYDPPDRRFQGDLILPSFQENVYGDSVDKLWFLIDTSGSISDDALAEAVQEIRDALDQLDSLLGELSFFDTAVSEPVPFASVEELSRIEPIGGGGTSFHAIFSALSGFYPEELPAAIIILTDGYAPFPDEDAACGVPTLWIIINSDVEAPWGECIHVDVE